MKIVFNSNQQNKAKYKHNFGQTPVYLQNLNGLQNYTDTFVKDSFEKEKSTKVDNLTSRVYSNIEKQWTDKVNNVERYKSDLNKSEMLNRISHVLYNAGETEKSAVVLADSFNKLPRNVLLNTEKSRIDNLIYNPENLQILKDFYTSSTNAASRLYVMKSLKNLNSPYYLPVAEDILEFDKDTAVYSDRQTTLAAREFLHSHYNFNLLKDPLSRNSTYKSAAMTLLDKWGLPVDVSLLDKMKNDEDIQIRNKALNVESHLKKLKNITNASSLNTQKTNYSVDTKKQLSFDTVVENLVNNVDTADTILELKRQKYPDGIYNASKLIKNINNIKNPETLSAVIKYIGQTGAFIEHLDYVKPAENQKTPYDFERAEAYSKILLRKNALSPSFKGSSVPSFSSLRRVWDKKKFDPLNAPDSTLDELAEIFHNEFKYKSSIQSAAEERYPEGFLESLFMDDNYKKKINIVIDRLYNRVQKVVEHKEKLLNEAIELKKKKALGVSNISKQKVRVNSNFIEPLKLSKQAQDVPLTNGILVYGQAFDSDKNKFIDWLKNESDASFVELTYKEDAPSESLNEIANSLNIAKNVYNLTGNRTILYVKGIDKLLTDLTSDTNMDYINEFKNYVEAASKDFHTTFLVKTNLPLKDFDSAAIASHRFGLKINLSEGITEDDQKRLDEINKEIARLDEKSRKQYDFYEFERDGYDNSDFWYRTIMYDTDF